MAYIEGFVAAVPAANEQAYRKHVAEVAPLFKEFGVTRMVETWGEEIPDGKVTDFKGSVQAKAGEVVVFSWMEYPSKEARDAAHPKIMGDPRMKAVGAAMPFDGKRMIYAGFAPIVEESTGGKTGYVDGSIVAVPAANKAAYRAMQAKAAAAIREHGATRVVEAWGDDVPDGKVTDFKKAVKAKGDETVVLAFIEWPSKDVRNAAWPKLMADPRLHGDADKKIFDAQRRIYGGFAPILDA
jgi:uncharacterized protein YbaA (DUF1428 family)